MKLYLRLIFKYFNFITSHLWLLRSYEEPTSTVKLASLGSPRLAMVRFVGVYAGALQACQRTILVPPSIRGQVSRSE